MRHRPIPTCPHARGAAEHQGCEGHLPGVFALHLLQHARVAVCHPADHKLVQMVAFPPHDPLQNTVELRSRRLAGDLHAAPDRWLAPLEGDFDLIDD
jgi:hypothetical protein